MPTSRIRIPPRQNARYSPVRAVLFGTVSANPVSLPIQTRIAEDLRSPLVEEALSGMETQSRVHDVQVTVRRGRGVHRFHIFFKNHSFLPINASILALVPGRQWHGDILVMRLGVKIDGVVNLRAEDGPLVRYTLRRGSYMQTVIDILILGAGSRPFLTGLCDEQGITYAATSRSGGESTIKFSFDPDSDDVELNAVIPKAHIVLIIFPSSRKALLNDW
ncbi:hypothetical protein GALMADRAFT_148392 [Galerina marginata CBS 339.88]|uniref:Uncharacterized protein n=1 Tax=Galerina marginata (strain CBS 339.88) TaxID=685588 RepID=A0A067SGB5_GALM3|nr:hypothetical protein GALMADRAFT_148392 [Galerina marginata CBS 339.88]